MDQFAEAWQQIEGSVASDNVSALQLVFHLLVGGFAALYIRWMYRKFSASPSDTDSVTRVFPLLVIVTTAVIAVVKSSLALSLGLVGALSIVRFRAAIKEPEELAYLFLCIAIGLALGAELPLVALALVAVASVFIVIMHRTGNGREHNLLLTVTGDSGQYFSGEKGAAITAIEEVMGEFDLLRLDIENGQGQLRVSLGRRKSANAAELIGKLRDKLPECDLSYVNLDAPV
jgi:hypothetical protein